MRMICISFYLVSDDGPDLAIEWPPASGAGVLASLVALLAQDMARHALQNQIQYSPLGTFVLAFMIKIGIFITNPYKLMNNAISKIFCHYK